MKSMLNNVFRRDSSGPRAESRFSRICGEIAVIAAVRDVEAASDGLFRFRIKVEGEAGTCVERVDDPLLPLAAPLQGDGAGDELVLGTTKGGVLVSRRRSGNALPGQPVVAGLAHRRRRGTGGARRGTVSDRSGGWRGNARRIWCLSPFLSAQAKT